MNSVINMYKETFKTDTILKSTTTDFNIVRYQLASSFAKGEDPPKKEEIVYYTEYVEDIPGIIGKYIMNILSLILFLGVGSGVSFFILNMLKNADEFHKTALDLIFLSSIFILLTCLCLIFYMSCEIINEFINPSKTAKNLKKTVMVDVDEIGLKNFNFLNTIYYSEISGKLKRGYEFIDFEESSEYWVVLKVPKQFKEIKENTEDFDIYDQFCLSKQSEDNLREIFKSTLEYKELKKTTEYLSLAEELRQVNDFKNIANDVENDDIEKKITKTIEKYN